jgi:hypothetical protein
MVMWLASYRQLGRALSQAGRSFGTTAALWRQVKLAYALARRMETLELSPISWTRRVKPVMAVKGR